MKIWKYILSAAALLSLGACNHDADPMVVPTRDVTISSHSAVVVSDVTFDEEFTLVWSAAKFGIQTEVEYTIAAAVNGNSVNLTTTSNLYYTTTNGALLEALGLTMADTYDVEFTVTATAFETGEASSDTESVALTLTKAGYVYVVGGYQGWKPAEASSRLAQGEDGLLRGFVNITDAAAAEVKFYTQQHEECIKYGMKNGKISTDADAANIVLTKGLHFLLFDYKNLTLVDVPLTKVALIGEAVGGWDKDYAEFTFDAATNLWTAVVENVAKDKEYKVRFNDMWDVVDANGNTYNISLGGESGNLAMGGGNLKAGYNGKVTFTLNLFDAPYTLTETGPAPDQLYIIGAYQGWNHSNPHSTLMRSGSQLIGFVNITDAAAAEIKFCSQLDWNGINYGIKDGAISTDGDSKNFTLAVGLHYLVLDFDTMTLSDTLITKVGLIGNGDAFGGWGTDVEMAFDAATNTWSATVNNVPADNEYKVRFNGGWDINLGTDAANLVFGGKNLKTVKSGTVTYVLNIFAHPYTIVEK